MAQPKTAKAADRPSSQDLEEELRVYERRLREGEDLVRHGRETGGDGELLDRWEAAWIKLLRQYELLYDRVQRQANAERQRATASAREG